MFHKTSILCLTAIAVLVLIGSAGAAQIYSDDFSGLDADVLNGTTPDVSTTGESWVASPTCMADGSFTTPVAFTTMTLAFTPVDGFVYTLDAQIEDIGGTQWVQFGFGDGQPVEGVWTTRAWDLLRANTDPRNPHCTSAQAGTAGGATGLANWSDLGLLRYDNDLDVRIVLDTTGEAGSWTATYYAKAGDVEDYTEVRSEVTLADETISAVGFSTFNSGNNTGKLISFSLSDNTADVLKGDADGDGDVDAADYIMIKRNMGTSGHDDYTNGDLTGDGNVDWDDLQALQSAMTVDTKVGTVIPEPATMSLLAFGAMALIRRRRRA